jgi:hypothetical protein
MRYDAAERTLYAASGRLIPFNSNSPTGSTFVLSTVLSAVDLGYRVILVEGALCSSSDESHAAILGLYRQRFDIQVSVADVEHILCLWKPP